MGAIGYVLITGEYVQADIGTLEIELTSPGTSGGELGLPVHTVQDQVPLTGH